MEAVDVNGLMFDAATQGLKNIFGDVSTAVIGLITILLIVFGLRWILGNVFFKRAEDDAEDLYNKMQNSSGHSKQIFTMKYRKAMSRLSKYED